MSQKQLAKKAAVSATMVSYIETGVKSVSVKTLYLMAKALDCTTDDLLKEKEKSAVWCPSGAIQIWNEIPIVND